MKSDLDRLMREAKVDAVWITGKGRENPSLEYFLGDAHLVRAEILKRRGEPAVLYHASIERDEARTTGLETVVASRQLEVKALEEAEGDPTLAQALLMRDRFQQLGIDGRIAIFGVEDSGRILGSVRHLERLLPDCEFLASEGPENLLVKARLTKHPDEIARMREVGKGCVEVVRRVEELLRGCVVEEDRLIEENGKPLTIGRVKRQLHVWLAERGLRSPDGPIFAMGRDGALGHSVGGEGEELRLGVPIVFDLFPREIGGGYNFDFTRTWCLGFAPPDVAELHSQVLSTYQDVVPLMIAGAIPKDIQAAVCDRFEAMGHSTVRTDPDSTSGFFHAVAHGIGLEIHESPIFYEHKADALLPLEEGMVLSFEPGLYYPEKGMGVRLEDTLRIRDEGAPETLAHYPHELVIPLEGVTPPTYAGETDGS